MRALKLVGNISVASAKAGGRACCLHERKPSLYLSSTPGLPREAKEAAARPGELQHLAAMGQEPQDWPLTSSPVKPAYRLSLQIQGSRPSRLE